MTALLSFGSDAPDIAAASQQLALIQAVYRNARSEIEAYLAGHGTIRAWVHQRGTWPPSWALIEGPDHQWFLTMEGTTNVGQWVGHALGSYALDDGPGGSRVNGAWKKAWDEINAQVKDIIGPAKPNTKLRISGHSYGGALAHLAGVEWAGEIGTDRVEVITFGAPKAFSDFKTVNHVPDVLWRFESTNDIVPATPPSAWYSYLAPGGLALILVWIGWNHIGSPVTLGPNGEVEM